MSDTLWSSKLQGTMTLDLSRELRFRDDRKDLILQLLRLQPGMSVAEIGCGPGALSRKLACWLGKTSQIIGIDRDRAFIEYAQRKAQECGLPNVLFAEGDALSLPMEDGSVDACTSHTVIEHVPNREFLLEQKRVTRSNGIVSAMISLGDKSIISGPAETPQMSCREKKLWKPIDKALKEENQEHVSRTYWVGYDGLPRLFQELKFREVQVDSIALPIVLDDSRNSIEHKRMIVEAERQQALESLEMGLRLVSTGITEEHEVELRSLVESRFNERLAMAEKGIVIWDYRISVVLIVSGKTSG